MLSLSVKSHQKVFFGSEENWIIPIQRFWYNMDEYIIVDVTDKLCVFRRHHIYELDLPNQEKVEFFFKEWSGVYNKWKLGFEARKELEIILERG